MCLPLKIQWYSAAKRMWIMDWRCIRQYLDISRYGLFCTLYSLRAEKQKSLYLQDEIPEGWRIKLFVTMGAKNYSYDEEDIITKEIIGRCTKVRGLTLSGPALEKMDTKRLMEFVQKIQENQRVEQTVPQYRLRINGISKKITATEVKKLYSNFSNEKRYFSSASMNSTKLWAYGTTSYQTM